MEATRSAADWHRLGCAAFEAGSRGGEARLLGQQTGVLGISDGVVADGPLRLLGDATLGCLLSLPVEAHTACRLVRRRSARGRLSPRPRRSLATGPASALAGGGAEIGEGKSEEQMGKVVKKFRFWSLRLRVAEFCRARAVQLSTVLYKPPQTSNP